MSSRKYPSLTPVSKHSSQIAHRTTSQTPPPLPKFSQLKCLTFHSNHENPDSISGISQFLTTRGDALCTLIINNRTANYLDSPLFISNLRNLYLSLTITSVYGLNQLLEGGRKLESLQLEVLSNVRAISEAFRPHSRPGSFPVLREFAFIFIGAENADNDNGDDEEYEDPDLFPAVAEVVRGLPILEALCLSFRQSSHNPKAFGYTAAIWGVLPSLVRLRTLSMDFPEDLSSALGGWLVPRTVVALEVRVPEGASSEIHCSVSMSPYLWHPG